MAVVHKSRAFILESRDYRETSRLLQVFCENEGQISLVARGLRAPKSKKATAAEVFNLVQVTYSLKDGATMGSLQAVEAERVFAAIREQLDEYALANYWFEIIRLGSQARLSSPDLFDLTESFLLELEKGLAVTTHVAWHFAKLLQALGYGVDLRACISCGRPGELRHLDVTAGGAVCAHCADPRQRYFPLSEGFARTLGQVFGERPPLKNLSLPQEEVQPLLLLLNELFSLNLDQPLKSYAFLRDILLGRPVAGRS